MYGYQSHIIFIYLVADKLKQLLLFNKASQVFEI